MAARPVSLRRPGRPVLRRVLERGQRGRQEVQSHGPAEEPRAVPRRCRHQVEERHHHQGRHRLGGLLRQSVRVHARVLRERDRGPRREDRRGREGLHHAPEPPARQRWHPLPAGSRPDGPRGAELPRPAADRLHHRQLRRARRQSRLLQGRGRRLLRPREHEGHRPCSSGLGHPRGRGHHGAGQHPARPVHRGPGAADPGLRAAPHRREVPVGRALWQPRAFRRGGSLDRRAQGRRL